MKVAAFLSHPNQHYTPLWRQLSSHPTLELTVYYYSRLNCVQSYDPEFQSSQILQNDLTFGYSHVFLPKSTPFNSQTSIRPHSINRRIVSEIAKGNWGAVILFGYDLLNQWLALATCHRRGIPTVFFSDSSIINETGKPKWKLSIKRHLLGHYFGRVSSFMAVGDHNKEYLIHYGAPEERIHFCPYPVDVSKFLTLSESVTPNQHAKARQELGFSSDDFVIAFIGKLIDRKRPVDLATAIQNSNDPRVKGLFIGSGPLESKLSQLAGTKIAITGLVDQSLVPKFLSLADIAVMPSSYDAHPLAVTEAMAAGLPVILSSRCGCYGPNDVFRDGDTGFIYECGDIPLLTERIMFLKRNVRVRMNLSEQAKKQALTQGPEMASAALWNVLRQWHVDSKGPPH